MVFPSTFLLRNMSGLKYNYSIKPKYLYIYIWFLSRLSDNELQNNL